MKHQRREESPESPNIQQVFTVKDGRPISEQKLNCEGFDQSNNRLVQGVHEKVGEAGPCKHSILSSQDSLPRKSPTRKRN